jgi:hypothetical protein
MIDIKSSKPKQAESFLQMKEVDDYDDDDADDSKTNEMTKLVKENSTSLKNENSGNTLVFTEVKSSASNEKDSNQIETSHQLNSNSQNNVEKKKGKKKEIDKLKYLKRKRKDSDLVRMKLFRIGKMNELQKTQQWRQSRGEGMYGKFSKIVAQQGNKKADEFVSFLGFMRDSAYRGNQNVFDSDVERFFK